ncbi:MAG: hypothetical protein P4M08_10785 [Oligoflexia bacterium]|nr:hypothetical protein [Oligoflexia bacterium]
MASDLKLDISGLAAWFREFTGEKSSVIFRRSGEAGPSTADLLQVQNELEALRSHFGRTRSRYFEPFEVRPSGSGGELRLREWFESRRCLLTALKDLLREGVDPSEIRMSISHTRGACVAAALASPEREGSEGRGSLGVDLEDERRIVSARAAARFHFQDERSLGLSDLEVWVIKEACFKSDSGRDGGVVSDYRLLSFSRDGLGEACSKKDAKSRFRFGIRRTGGHLVGFALSQ